MWFNLECPDRFKDYRDPLKLRNIFSQVKKGKAVERPAYVRLWSNINTKLSPILQSVPSLHNTTFSLQLL